MLKKLSLKLTTILFITILLSVAVISQPASALLSQNITSWYSISDTNASAIAVGDVNGDGVKEIVTGGYYNNGTHWLAQVKEWNSATMNVINEISWIWGPSTQVTSIALANITKGLGLDIVTGGSYFDGTRWVSQLQVWNGVSLANERVQTWYWASDTEISSLAIADVNGDGQLEIVTGGAYSTGSLWIAQLHLWNALTLAPVNVASWYWTSNTCINSIAIANITGGTGLEIVTVGTYFDGVHHNAQMHIFNGNTLTVEKVIAWYWGGDTDVSTVAVAYIFGTPTPYILTGGSFFDGTRLHAQLMIWDPTTPQLSVLRETNWYNIGNTTINYVLPCNFTGGSNLDLITCGAFNDGLRSNAQVIDFASQAFAVNSMTSWYTTSDTNVNAVLMSNFGVGNRLIVAGSYWDNFRSNAQIIFWT